MKAIKKRSGWQRFLWHIRHPLLSCRAAALSEIHRKRILREYKECMCKGYDPEFERWWRKELREMNRPKEKNAGVFST